MKAYDLITSPAYVLLKASDKFTNPTPGINKMWQTDFTYFKVVGWGWYYLSTVMDDYSRYILSWKLFSSMTADDAKQTLDLAVEKAGVNNVHIWHRPRLLSDNGPCYISGELKKYLEEHRIDNAGRVPYYPQAQGKIERYHRTMKNLTKLQHYYMQGELEREIRQFAEYYNNQRCHESLDNLTPADVYYSKDIEILTKRGEIKKRTLNLRKQQNLRESIFAGNYQNHLLRYYQSC